jgi:YVTN family beta-propeller protein
MYRAGVALAAVEAISRRSAPVCASLEIVAHCFRCGSGFSLEMQAWVVIAPRRADDSAVNTLAVPARGRLRLAVVATSAAAAIVGSIGLAIYSPGATVTTRGVRATLPLSGHPAWVAAGQDALWIALSDTRQPVRDVPLLHLDLAGDAVVDTPLFLGGRVTYLSHVGDRLLATVENIGGTGAGPTSVVAVDWRNGNILARRQFSRPLGPLVRNGNDLWALQLTPSALWRFNPRTLAPNATPLPLLTRRVVGLAAGAGYLWVTAGDGDLLRIDPARRTIARAHLGGAPTGVVVAGDEVWVTDEDHGSLNRLDPRTLEQIGAPIHLGGKPASLVRAGRYLFVTDTGSGTVTKIAISSGKKAGSPIRVARPAGDSPPLTITPADDSVWVSSYASKTVTRVGDTRGADLVSTSAHVGRAAAPNVLPLPLAGSVVATIRVPSQGGAFAVGEGAVWAMSDTTSTLMRIDPMRNRIVARIKMPPAEDAAAGDGAVWLTNPELGTVTRLDPKSDSVIATIRVGGQPSGLAVSPGAVWVTDPSGPSVTRIAPGSNRVVARIRAGPTSACCSDHMGVTASRGAVWAALPSVRSIVRIDPRTNKVAGTARLDFIPCGFLAADATAVWSAGADCTRVVARLDSHSRRVTAELAAPHAVGVALAFGSVWVASLESGNVDRIDPTTARAAARLHVGGFPVRLGVGFGSVWVNDDKGRVLRIQPQP